VVGAFAYPLARALNINSYAGGFVEWGEGRVLSNTMKAFLESTVSASAGIVATGQRGVGIAVYSEMGRIIAVPYKGATELGRIKKPLFTDEFYTESLTRAMPVQAMGSAYAPGGYLELSWVVDVDQLSKELGVSVEAIDKVAEKAVYGAVRVGSKEGIVAVEPSYTKFVKNPVKVNGGGKIRTRLYLDTNCVEPLDPAYTFEIALPDLKYRGRLFYLPALSASKVLVIPLREAASPPLFRVLSPCKAICAPGENYAYGVSP